MSDLNNAVPTRSSTGLPIWIAGRDFDLLLVERTVIDASWMTEAPTVLDRPAAQRGLQARCQAVASPTPLNRRTDVDAEVTR